MSEEPRPQQEEPTDAEFLAGVLAAPLAIIFGCVFLSPLAQVPSGWVGELGRLTPEGWSGWGWLAAWLLTVLVSLPVVRFLRRKPGTGLSVVRLAALAVACLLVGLFATASLHLLGLLPATRSYLADRSLPLRLSSANNLNQLAWSMHDPEARREWLPAGCLVDAAGEPIHGWPVQMLPFLERDALYRQVRLDRPWTAPGNAEVFRERVATFEHVAHSFQDADGYALNFYAANVHVVGGDRPRRLAEFAGMGTGNVLLFGEVGDGLKPWGYPIQWRNPALGLNTSPHGFGTPVGLDSVQFVMLDGSVRVFDGRRTDPKILEALQGGPSRRGAAP